MVQKITKCTVKTVIITYLRNLGSENKRKPDIFIQISLPNLKVKKPLFLVIFDNPLYRKLPDHNTITLSFQTHQFCHLNHSTFVEFN